MSTRILTPAEEQQRKELRERYTDFETWRAGRQSYKPEEVPSGLALTNEQRSRLERFDFIADPPKSYFAYFQEVPNPKEITTFTGDTLASVTWLGDDYKTPGSGWSVRVNFRALGINGRKYAGTYYKSERNYCRMREVRS